MGLTSLGRGISLNGGVHLAAAEHYIWRRFLCSLLRSENYALD